LDVVALIFEREESLIIVEHSLVALGHVLDVLAARVLFVFELHKITLVLEREQSLILLDAIVSLGHGRGSLILHWIVLCIELHLALVFQVHGEVVSVQNVLELVVWVRILRNWTAKFRSWVLSTVALGMRPVIVQVRREVGIRVCVLGDWAALLWRRVLTLAARLGWLHDQLDVRPLVLRRHVHLGLQVCPVVVDM